MGRILLSLALLLLAGAASALDIATCDVTVPRGEVGVLVADLNCGPSYEDDSYAVWLENGATLDLAGHTITGPQFAVYCVRKCTVVGPGTLTGAFYGIWGGTAAARVKASDVTIASNLGGMAISRATLSNVTLTDNVVGLDVSKIDAENLTVTACHGDYTLEVDAGKIDGLTLTGNVAAQALVLMEGGSLRLSNASFSGNTAPVGILGLSGNLRLFDSVVEGQQTDLFTARRPRLTNSTCGTSARYGDPPHLPWSVCTND